MDTFQKVAVHAFIEKDGKFLTTLRSSINDYKPGEWDFPGGTVEFSEEPLEALNREILEETGLKVEISKPIYVCSQAQDSRHQFWIIYECKYVGGEVKLNPEEHEKYLWVDNSKISKLPMIYFLNKFYEDYLTK